MPFFVMAHEMGHQWGLPYALVEGLPFLAEGLATFQAMQVVQATHGDAQLRRLMRFLRQPFPYPPMRRGEPLLRAMDPHMARRKGPFAMWLLSEYMGADRVNGTIRRLTERSDMPGARPVSTLDLYRELQAVAPDSLEPLLHDLFEINAFWQLATERVRAEPLANGAWRVTMDVRARKMVYDSAGVERELPMDEWVPVGVFTQGEPGDELGKPLHLERHRIRTGRQTITVTVQGKPVLAGIDPHHLLDWEEKEEDDNVAAVETGSRPGTSGETGGDVRPRQAGS
jgi:ABC-2 type transport system permease protein